MSTVSYYLACIANRTSNDITFINLDTSQVLYTKNANTKTDVNSWPTGIAFSQNNQYLYITNAGTNELTVFQSGAQWSLLEKATQPVKNKPGNILVVNDKIFVVCQADNVIASLAQEKDKLNPLADTPTGANSLPWGVASSPDKNLLYVTNYNNGKIDTYNIKETGLTKFSSVETGTPSANYSITSICVTNKYIAYIACPKAGIILIADLSNNRILDFIKLETPKCSILNNKCDPLGLALSKDYKELYVTSPCAGTLTIIDTNKNVIIGNTEVGRWPVAVTIHPDNPNQIYVVNQGDNELAILNRDLRYVRGVIFYVDKRLKVGKSPRNIAVTSNPIV
ncbi:MAG: hypothetical protein RLZ12_468 [Bacillota bacterium]